MVDINVKSVIAAQNRGFSCSPSCKIGLEHAEIFRHIVIETENPVSVAEPHLMRQLIYINAVAFIAQIALSPMGKHA